MTLNHLVLVRIQVRQLLKNAHLQVFYDRNPLCLPDLAKSLTKISILNRPLQIRQDIFHASQNLVLVVGEEVAQ